MTPGNETAFAGIISPSAEGTLLNVQVLPRSSRSGIAGIQAGALKVKLTEPPLDGRANDACCRLVAKQVGVPKSRVSIRRGKASRNKTLLIAGAQPDAVIEQLKQYCT